MIPTLNKPIYIAFGYRLASDIALPELPVMQDMDQTADIVVERADLSEEWGRLAVPNRTTFVTVDRIMFQIAGTATYCIQDGNKIIVSPMAGSDEDRIRLYILGSCMGALLFQRRILPLHGSAVEIGGKAYAFVGDSGAGKSTLATAFIQRGYPLVSDDVIAVSLAPDQTPMVMPSYPQQKLWQESLDGFDMENASYRPIFQRETKFAVPVPGMFYKERLPLAGIFELVKSDMETMQMYPIRNLEKLSILYGHTYRNSFISRLGLMEWHLNMTAGMASKLGLFRLYRPITGFTAPDLASLILNLIDKEG
ncbi:HPr kinase/phosphorylase [Cohnella lupini]|uniref:HPr serine kinase-like protein n=1 Tax=Cohnella lupini TaxID=1294267 RepID=A0A3D9IMM8_9BACL|nr:aldolase [Cohnella lupini]RED63033.1 HPr serine kinase-like protein [Cohnella lupini]